MTSVTYSAKHTDTIVCFIECLIQNLQFKDVKTRPYAMFHAGTEDHVKSSIVDSITKVDGTVRVLFAATAFGMGVN